MSVILHTNDGPHILRGNPNWFSNCKHFNFIVTAEWFFSNDDSHSLSHLLIYSSVSVFLKTFSQTRIVCKGCPLGQQHKMPYCAVPSQKFKYMSLNSNYGTKFNSNSTQS